MLALRNRLTSHQSESLGVVNRREQPLFQPLFRRVLVGSAVLGTDTADSRGERPMEGQAEPQRRQAAAGSWRLWALRRGGPTIRQQQMVEARVRRWQAVRVGTVPSDNERHCAETLDRHAVGSCANIRPGPSSGIARIALQRTADRACTEE